MPSDLKVESKPLFCPTAEQVLKVFEKKLPETFETVNVEIVDCPDLTKAPFHLASEGLGGSPKLVELGGAPYLLPDLHKDKLYNLSELGEICGVDPAFVVGAGAGPWPHVGFNSEMVANMKLEKGAVKLQQTRVVKMKDGKKGEDFSVQVLPPVETRCALLANLFLSEGKPGKVIKIQVKKRIGPANFISALREALESEYGSNPVGLGGVFLVKEGKVKQHIMPQFSETPIYTEEELNNWLCFFEMPAPLVAVGTFVSADPDLDLRLQHFHSFGLHGYGGHYHYDTTPDTIEYEAYLNIADYVYRVDRPEITHTFGRD